MLSSKLQIAVENLYKVFKRPRILQTPIGCIDYVLFGYDIDEEQEYFSSTPLKEISAERIEVLEFYNETWDSWGNEDEVKYFLPRIAECIAQDISLLDNPAPMSLFIYKMADLFKETNSKWSKEETLYLKNYLFKLFELYVASSIDLLPILDVLYPIVDNMEPFLAIWEKAPKDLKSKQIKIWLEHNVDRDSCSICPSYGFTSVDQLQPVFDWVTSDKNIVEMDIFHEDPWWKLSCTPRI